CITSSRAGSPSFSTRRSPTSSKPTPPRATSARRRAASQFFKHRMVLPFTGAYEELEHVVGHEMVHQFQYDVFSRGRIGAGIQTYVNINPPLWFMEGMAEYLSVGPIDNHTAMWLRDASVEGHL